jgi:[CysO sulfur-carrier protein]-S-L-cysteine hydrolase
VVRVPAVMREALVEHASDEAPNEACGLIVLRGGIAERYIRGRNTLASPYRFQLEVDPEDWFLEDEGYELAVFHSHPETAARPSRTDIENVGLWTGKPYLIYSLARDELAAWTITDEGAVEPLELEAL